MWEPDRAYRRQPPTPGPPVDADGRLLRPAALRAWVAHEAQPYGFAVSRRRLLGRGLPEATIDHMVQRRDLYEHHRGVYAVGRPELPPYGVLWAAFLATRGKGAAQHPRALSTRSAAALLGVGDAPPCPEIVVVGAVLDVPGVTVRRTRSLLPAEVVQDRLGLCWTSWIRTTIDLGAVCSDRAMQDHLDRSDRAKLLDLEGLAVARRGVRGKPGLAWLTRALRLYEDVPEGEYLSRLERLAAQVLVPAGIPAPEVNGRVLLPDGGSIRVDLLLRDARIAIELDGRQHGAGTQFQVDRWRDRQLQLLGYVVLRFTWFDVVHRPHVVVADVLRFLGLARGVGGCPRMGRSTSHTPAAARVSGGAPPARACGGTRPP